MKNLFLHILTWGICWACELLKLHSCRTRQRLACPETGRTSWYQATVAPPMSRMSCSGRDPKSCAPFRTPSTSPICSRTMSRQPCKFQEVRERSWSKTHTWKTLFYRNTRIFWRTNVVRTACDKRFVKCIEKQDGSIRSDFREKIHVCLLYITFNGNMAKNRIKKNLMSCIMCCCKMSSGSWPDSTRILLSAHTWRSWEL